MLHPYHYDEMAWHHYHGRAYMPYGKVANDPYSPYDPYRGHLGVAGPYPGPYLHPGMPALDAEEAAPGDEGSARSGSRSASPRSSSPKSPRAVSPVAVRRVAVQMINVKEPNVSAPVDLVDPIHKCLDPISVSLQERVKFGGHITSVTRKSHAVQAFFFQLNERGRAVQITKPAILSAEIERQENRARKPKVLTIIK